MKTVLIIEDDRKISDLVKMYLLEEGYEALTAFDGAEGLRLAEEKQPDFIILDLGLPELDGMEIAKRVRQKSTVPILMLTARSEEIDKILGLELGADDYLTKPFSPKELMARVKAILRRSEITRDTIDNGIFSVRGTESMKSYLSAMKMHTSGPAESPEQKDCCVE